MADKIKFLKMHGLGNDFIMLDRITQYFHISPALVKKISHRNFGIGCDQVLLIDPPVDPAHDFNYRIFNGNGKEVEQCGNGARCFGKYIHDMGLSDKKQILVGSLGGPIKIDIHSSNNIIVHLGHPKFPPNDKFFNTRELKANKTGRFNLPVNKKPKDVYLLSIGNPHCIVSVPSLKEVNVEALGQSLQNQSCFVQGVNVSFVELLARNHIKIKVYERDAGETQACGTAAAACVIAGIKQNELNASVQVDMPGGSLSVNWHQEEGVSISGPTHSVFEGYFKLSEEETGK